MLIVVTLFIFAAILTIPVQHKAGLFYITFRFQFAVASIFACMLWFRIFLLWQSDPQTVATCCCACVLLDAVLSFILHKIELSDRNFMWRFVNYLMLASISFLSLWRIVKKVNKSPHAKSYSLVGFIWWVAGLHVVFASYFFTQGFFHFLTHTANRDGLKFMYYTVFIVVMAVFRMLGTYKFKSVGYFFCSTARLISTLWCLIYLVIMKYGLSKDWCENCMPDANEHSKL